LEPAPEFVVDDDELFLQANVESNRTITAAPKTPESFSDFIWYRILFFKYIQIIWKTTYL